MMTIKTQARSERPSIRELYPELHEDELESAQENLDRFIEHAVRMYRRILAEPEALGRFRALTSDHKDDTKKSERSNPPYSNNPQQPT